MLAAARLTMGPVNGFFHYVGSKSCTAPRTKKKRDKSCRWHIHHGSEISLAPNQQTRQGRGGDHGTHIIANLRFLQGNINYCAGAQDLLLQTMAKWLIHAAVVAESYSVPPRDNWASDREDTVDIFSQCFAGSPPLEKVAKK